MRKILTTIVALGAIAATSAAPAQASISGASSAVKRSARGVAGAKCRPAGYHHYKCAVFFRDGFITTADVKQVGARYRVKWDSDY